MLTNICSRARKIIEQGKHADLLEEKVCIMLCGTTNGERK
jgi:hypothetical protein